MRMKSFNIYSFISAEEEIDRWLAGIKNIEIKFVSQSSGGKDNEHTFINIFYTEGKDD